VLILYQVVVGLLLPFLVVEDLPCWELVVLELLVVQGLDLVGLIYQVEVVLLLFLVVVALIRDLVLVGLGQTLCLEEVVDPPDRDVEVLLRGGGRDGAFLLEVRQGVVLLYLVVVDRFELVEVLHLVWELEQLLLFLEREHLQRKGDFLPLEVLRLRLRLPRRR
jgi:hypothetical protein